MAQPQSAATNYAAAAGTFPEIDMETLMVLVEDPNIRRQMSLALGDLHARLRRNTVTYVQSIVNPLVAHINAQNTILNNVSFAQDEVINQLTRTVGEMHDDRARKGIKPSDATTFSGTDKQQDLEAWLNQVYLYCRLSGITSDEYRVLYAMSRLRGPAEKYSRKYWETLRANGNVGTWADFEARLNQIYGKKDQREGAKDELMDLWDNKKLAMNDFIGYISKYRTLASLLPYDNSIHMDRINRVIPEDLRKAMVGLEMAGKLPTEWEDLIDTLMQAYKMLHPEKSKSYVFGKGSTHSTGNHPSGSSSRKEKDPNAMDVDVQRTQPRRNNNPQASSSSPHPKRFCKWCKDHGRDSASRTHDEEYCHGKKKEIREGKKPAENPPTSPKKGKQTKDSRNRARAARVNKSDDEDEHLRATYSPTATLSPLSIASTPNIKRGNRKGKMTVVQVAELPVGKTGETQRKSRSELKKAERPYRGVSIVSPLPKSTIEEVNQTPSTWDLFHGLGEDEHQEGLLFKRSKEPWRSERVSKLREDFL